MKSCLILLFALFLLSQTVHAQVLRPNITQVNPSGGQRGTTVTVTLVGINLGTTTQLLTDGTGLTIESLTPEAPAANARNPEGKVVVRFKIAPDAPLGRHPLRLLTPFGPSEIGYFVVGEWPEIAEKEPNNTREQAQKLVGPVTVVGRSDGAEDIDTFAYTMQKGETIVFAVAAGSIGSAQIPVLTLRDSAGQERGFAAALNQPDAVLIFTAPEAGDYFLSLRDMRYQGGVPYHYRLTAGRVPVVNNIFPLGAMVGTTARLTLNGVNLPNPAERTLAMPKERPLTPIALPDIGSPRLEVGTDPEIIEVEKNDLPETAQRVTIPVTINGRIVTPGSTVPDVDCFRFTATKGQVLSLEVVAAQLGSPLDGVLTVLDGKGKELASNDDAHGKDPALAFTVPENGEYIARVSDLNGRTGEAFAYRLHIGPALPDFQLAVSPDCVSVGVGDRIPVTVTATRQNGFDGDIALMFAGLPAGMRLTGTMAIPKGQTTVTLMVAADGTTLLSSPLQVTGTATIGGKTVVHRAESLEVSYTKEGDQLKQNTRPVPFALATITGPPELIVTAGAEKLSLAVGKTVELKVRVQRRADCTAKIPLIVQGLPTGVTVSGNEVAEKANEATLVFKAEGNATVGDISVILFGRSLVDELHFSDHYAQPIVLTVSK